jgi:uncharacterized membrane protein YhaH (DUF805 family)
MRAGYCVSGKCSTSFLRRRAIRRVVVTIGANPWGAHMDWYIGVLKKFADFSGRARRKEYWMWALFYIIGVIVLSIIDGILGLRAANGLGLLSGVFMLLNLVPSIAVGVRRLHDRDMSGWFMLLGLVPLAGIALLVIFCLEGTRGSNKYGPDPKGIAG